MKVGKSNPIKKIASRFGGGAPMARALGYPQQTVAAWIVTGFVPAKHVRPIIEAAANLKPPIVLHADDFFYETESANAAE